MGNLEFVRSELIELLPRLQRYARNLSSSRPDADELVQMTCLRVLEKHEQFRPGTNFDRWAFTIMSSIRSNFLRKQNQTENLDDSDITLHVNDNSETNTYYHQVLAQLQKLPMAQRQVMLLVYYEGFSYQETADMLEIPSGTVMSRIARARAKLAECLQDTNRPEI